MNIVSAVGQAGSLPTCWQVGWTAATSLEAKRSYQAFALRARAHAELGHWDRAAEDYNEALALAFGHSPKDPGAEELLLRVGQSWVQLAQGDVKNYRASCLQLIHRFGDAPFPEYARVVARVCTLVPDAVAEYAPLLRSSELLVKNEKVTTGDLEMRAIVLYRNSQLEEARQQLDAAVKANTSGITVEALLYLAMIQHRLGQRQQAQDSMEKIRRWFDRNRAELNDSASRSFDWRSRLKLSLLRREAEAVLQSPPVSDK